MRTKIGNRVWAFDDIAEKAFGHLLEQPTGTGKEITQGDAHIVPPLYVYDSTNKREYFRCRALSFNSKRDCCPENYRPLCNFLDAIASISAAESRP